MPGGAPDALWTRFRGACDAVFAARAAARADADRRAIDALTALVDEAEALAAEGADGDVDRTIDGLLLRWKRVGRAPRDAQQALWERLRAAFDRLRAPPVDLSSQDPSRLSFRPFAGLPDDR